MHKDLQGCDLVLDTKEFDFLGICDDRALADRKIRVFSFGQVDSTNSLAKRMITSSEKLAPALLVADSQTGGRGRMGRSFFSPSETGIYMSLALDVTDRDISSVTRMTSAAAVAVCRAIADTVGRDPLIKWVNDLYLDGKKVCGILAESFFAGDKRIAVVGVGINLSTEDFPEEIRNIAGSLGKDTSLRKALTVAVATQLFDILDTVKNGDASYMEEYRKRSLVLGKAVDFTADGVTRTGVAVAVEADGALRVLLSDGSERVLSSGEISLRLR